MLPHATEQPQNDEYDLHEAENPTDSRSAIAIVAVIAPPPPSSRITTTMIQIVLTELFYIGPEATPTRNADACSEASFSGSALALSFSSSTAHD